MSRIEDAEEVRSKYVTAMGQELGGLFDKLSQELTWLYCGWIQYEKLFGETEARVEVLNQSAPEFFFIIQQILWSETLLGITRLAGPEKTGRKNNLSVKHVLPLIVNETLRQELSHLLTDMDEKSSFAMEWRNKHLAHRDLEQILSRDAQKLPEVTRQRVNTAIEAIASFLNRVEKHFLRSTTAYSHVLLSLDADQLVYVLRDGIRLEEIRREKCDQGIYDPKNWNDDLPPI